MKVTKIPGLGRFGIFIDDLDLMTISDDEWVEIGKLHLKSLVTILRNVNCSKEKYPEIISKFGAPRPTNIIARKYRKKYGKSFTWVVTQARKNSNLIDEIDRYIINTAESVTIRTNNGYAMAKVAGGYDNNGHPNGFFSEGDLDWHSNESGTLTFTPGVALMGYKNMVGSSTGFLTTTDYYESISESFRSELDEMIILHRYTPNKIAPGNDPNQDKVLGINMCPIDDTEVPLVIKSPGGIIGLHYSINTMHLIKGATKVESDRIFKIIGNSLFVEKYIYNHWYQQNNDICLFDNTITQHRRLGYIDGRVGFRIPYDFTYVQAEPYQPYLQPLYQRRYNKEIREIIKEAQIDFTLPKFGIIDRIKSAFEN